MEDLGLSTEEYTLSFYFSTRRFMDSRSVLYPLPTSLHLLFPSHLPSFPPSFFRPSPSPFLLPRLTWGTLNCKSSVSHSKPPRLAGWSGWSHLNHMTSPHSHTTPIHSSLYLARSPKKLRHRVCFLLCMFS